VVRLIDHENNQVGIIDTHEALARAREVELDLVEVAPTSEPPVCRIMDYGKWLYEQKRKAREAHKKHSRHAATLKEIRLRPETDTRDLGSNSNMGENSWKRAIKSSSPCFSADARCSIESTVTRFSSRLLKNCRI